MAIMDWLSRVKLNWNDFDEAGRISRELITELAANRPLLRNLVLNAATDNLLRSFAEKHNELNYVVLYDALDRGLRIRLHRFSRGLEDIPHNHRFSFSSTILSGSYVHSVFRLDTDSDDSDAGSKWRLDQPIGTYTGAKLQEIELNGFKTIFSTTQEVGSTYSMHHEAVHKTAMPLSDAFSLFVRGPALKRCSLQLQPDDRTYRWKFGREGESTDVVASRAMSTSEYDAFVASLETNGII